MNRPRFVLIELMAVVALVAFCCTPYGLLCLFLFCYIIFPGLVLPLYYLIRSKEAQPLGSTWRDRLVLAILVSDIVGLTVFALSLPAMLRTGAMGPEAIGLGGLALPGLPAGVFLIDAIITFLRSTRWLPPRR
jgi:hypothetical protein